MKATPEDLPPVVYVPCIESSDSPGELRVAMRRTKDDRRALLAYSALDRLVEGYGDDSQWVLLSLSGLQTLYDQDPYDLLLMDILVPEKARSEGWDA